MISKLKNSLAMKGRFYKNTGKSYMLSDFPILYSKSLGTELYFQLYSLFIERPIENYLKLGK